MNYAPRSRGDVFLVMTEDYKDKETLERLYWEEEMTLGGVAERLGCGKMTIQRWMKKLDIPRREHGQQPPKPWHDKDTLQQLYQEEKMSLREVGDELGCNSDTIRRWLGNYDIEIRDRLEFMKTGPCAHYWSDGYEVLQNVYDGESYETRVHRLIAVAEYGFEAVSGKVVHHKNGVRWDNRPENLEVMTTEEHSRYHANESERWKNLPNYKKSIA